MMDNPISILTEHRARALERAEAFDKENREVIAAGREAQRALALARQEVDELDAAIAELTRAQRRTSTPATDAPADEAREA